MTNLLRPKELKKITLKVVNSQGGCKYHPRIGQRIGLRRALPKDVCPYLYVAAYPYALSLLYGAEFSWRKKVDKDSVIAQCCKPSGQMAFKVKRMGNKNADKALLKKYEEERYVIFIELIGRRNGKPDCSDCLGYKSMVVGNKFEFNRGGLPEICPAAFNQFFPLLIELLHYKRLKSRIRFACPDPQTNVIFEAVKK